MIMSMNSRRVDDSVFASSPFKIIDTKWLETDIWLVGNTTNRKAEKNCRQQRFFSPLQNNCNFRAGRLEIGIPNDRILTESFFSTKTEEVRLVLQILPQYSCQGKKYKTCSKKIIKIRTKDLNNNRRVYCHQMGDRDGLHTDFAHLSDKKPDKKSGRK